MSTKDGRMPQWTYAWKSRMTAQAADVSRHDSAGTLQDRRIAIGFLWVSLFVLLAKGVGALKEMAIAWRFGASSTVDAYVLVFLAATWPISIWFSVLCLALVPLGKLLRKFATPWANSAAASLNLRLNRC